MCPIRGVAGSRSLIRQTQRCSAIRSASSVRLDLRDRGERRAPNTFTHGHRGSRRFSLVVTRREAPCLRDLPHRCRWGTNFARQPRHPGDRHQRPPAALTGDARRLSCVVAQRLDDRLRQRVRNSTDHPSRPRRDTSIALAALSCDRDRGAAYLVTGWAPDRDQQPPRRLRHELRRFPLRNLTSENPTGMFGLSRATWQPLAPSANTNFCSRASA
jgi:hypothetical protein